MIPTLHVSDLGAYVAAVAATAPGTLPSQYLLACDDVNVTQVDLVQGVSAALGTGQTRWVG